MDGSTRRLMHYRHCESDVRSQIYSLINFFGEYYLAISHSKAPKTSFIILSLQEVLGYL